MSTNIDKLVANARKDDARRERPEHPKGWEPGVSLSGDRGTITTRPSTERDPKWDEHLKSWGFDPELFEIVEPFQVRTWESFAKNNAGAIEKVQLWYHRANVVSRVIREDFDHTALLKEIQRYRRRKIAPPTGDAALLVAFADWQLGKRDGAGTQAVVDRVLFVIDQLENRLRELRRTGHAIGSLYVAGLGDLFEGCDGQYPMQTFSVELNRRDQIKVGRRLLHKAITRWAPLVEKMIVLCVPGNHGEHRKNGKAFTDLSDNDDVAVFEQLAETFAENSDAFDHVSFVIPEDRPGMDEMTVTLDIAGKIVTFAHGHQMRGSNGPVQWWKGQAYGNQAPGDADILVHGHFHHLTIVEEGPRTRIQCPALESTSSWFKHTRGISTKAGTLSVVVTPEGWTDLAIL